MNFIKTAIAVAALAWVAGTAQAARLQLVQGTISTFGSSQTVVDAADGERLSFTGTADDLSGPAELLAMGAADHAGTLPTSGLAFGSSWVRMASLDASAAVTRLQATGTTALQFDGAANLAGAQELADVGLAADLRVASDGEADGTPVQVRLLLSAESLFESSLASAEDTPTFNLLVQDAAFNTLVRYNGLALNGTENLDLQFNSAVGQTLSLSLSYANALSIGSEGLSGLQTASSSALLDGTLSVTAVPEPQSMLLLLAGLGVVATSARRRR